MKKKELIDKWLSKGKLLSPEVIKQRELDLTQLSGELVLRPKPSPKILKKTEKTESRTVEQIQKFYRERFEKLKAILLKRIDKNQLLSINKISTGFSGVIIGMVCNVNKTSFILEDLTGCVRVKKNGFEPIEDEVIAVRGEYQGKFLKPLKVIRPDTEMRVRKGEIEAKALFLSGPLKKSEVREIASSYEASYGFVLNCEEKIESRNFIALPFSDNFALLKLAGLRIMLLRRKIFPQFDSKDLLSWLQAGLRRRHLNPLSDWKANDVLLLKSVPDIIHSSAESAHSTNYKGTSILLTSKQQGFLIDIKSRKMEMIAG